MIDAATKLLDDFKKLPGRVVRPRTFMEIAGYPHYESVCSNILAFFMDPEQSHGLGTLLLDALAGAGKIGATSEGLGGNVSVEREVSTDAGNRIDLLITSDDHAILIENKIFASSGNPFLDYAEYLDRTANGRKKHKLLLTLGQKNEGSRWGFMDLTYEELVQQIRSLLGRYVSGADTRYLTILLDFLNTLDNLQKGTRMDQGFVKLLAERTDDAENFLTGVTGFRDELRKKVRELGGLVELEEHQNVRQYFYREKTALFDDLVHDIRISEDLLAAVDTVVDPQGWRSFIWPRQGDRSELETLLRELNISFEEGNLSIPSTQLPRFVHFARFTYDEDPNRISPILQNVIDRLATSHDKKRRLGTLDGEVGERHEEVH